MTILEEAAEEIRLMPVGSVCVLVGEGHDGENIVVLVKRTSVEGFSEITMSEKAARRLIEKMEEVLEA